MTQVLATSDFEVDFVDYTKGQVIDFADAGQIAHLRARGVVNTKAADVNAAISAGAVQKVHAAGKRDAGADFDDALRRAVRDIAPQYRFFLPGRQFAGSGNIKDLSGNGADGVIQSGITDAQLWAARGYYSGVAANGGKCIVAADKSAFDVSRQSVIFSTVINMANPAAGQTIFGNGAVGFFGFYLSLRPGGTMRPIVITADGNYNGLADSTAVFGDGTDHVVGLALDGTTGEIKLFCDGALSNAYAANSFGRSQASQSTAAFGLLGQAGGGTTGYVGKAYGTHLLVQDGGLPANLALVMAKLAGAPAVHLTAADLDW